MNYKNMIIGAVVYFLSSLVIQGILGFVLAADYFASIPILRNPPIIYLAMSQTVIAGVAFAILYPVTNFQGAPLWRGLQFGLLIGFIMVPFVAFDLPARFMIPSMEMWIWVQVVVGMLHYAVAGSVIGLIYGQET